MAGSDRIIGVLALQGDFARHVESVNRLGTDSLLVRRAEQLQSIDALILPGGESTTLLRLLDPSFRQALREAIGGGLPTLATCAGAILVANEVVNPTQDSLQLIDIRVARNDYGRQLDSFVTREVLLTAQGVELFAPVIKQLATVRQETGKQDDVQALSTPSLSGVFIRAPRVVSVGAAVEVVATQNGDPVLLKQGHLLVATFHPELSTTKSPVHQLLLNLADAGACR